MRKIAPLLYSKSKSMACKSLKGSRLEYAPPPRFHAPSSERGRLDRVHKKASKIIGPHPGGDVSLQNLESMRGVDGLIPLRKMMQNVIRCTS